MNRVKTEIPATLEEAAQAGRVCMDVKKKMVSFATIFIWSRILQNCLRQ